MQRIEFDTFKKVPDLIWQLCVGHTGLDDVDTARWVWVRMQQFPEIHNLQGSQAVHQGLHRSFERAVIHWEYAPEELKDAIGPFFGLGEPTTERWPCLNKIKADYDAVLHFISQLLDEPY